ncbi:MAG: hypothetical protein QJR07_16320, partial [Acetobacteraceae bacterium]|nr:hypothetical protein [Acetobacteraceae bacterium]
QTNRPWQAPLPPVGSFEITWWQGRAGSSPYRVPTIADGDRAEVLPVQCLNADAKLLPLIPPAAGLLDEMQHIRWDWLGSYVTESF